MTSYVNPDEHTPELYVDEIIALIKSDSAVSQKIGKAMLAYLVKMCWKNI